MNTNIVEDILRNLKQKENRRNVDIYKYTMVEFLLRKYLKNLYGEYVFPNSDYKKEIVVKGKDMYTYKLTRIDGTTLDVDVYATENELIVRGTRNGEVLFAINSNNKLGKDKVESTMTFDGLTEYQETQINSDELMCGIETTAIKQTKDGQTVYRKFDRMGVNNSYDETELYDQYGIDPVTNKRIKQELSALGVKGIVGWLHAKITKNTEAYNKFEHDYDDPNMYVPYFNLPSDGQISNLIAKYDRSNEDKRWSFQELNVDDRDELLQELTDAYKAYESERESTIKATVDSSMDLFYSKVQYELDYKLENSEVNKLQ